MMEFTPGSREFRTRGDFDALSVVRLDGCHAGGCRRGCWTNAGCAGRRGPRGRRARGASPDGPDGRRSHAGRLHAAAGAEDQSHLELQRIGRAVLHAARSAHHVRRPAGQDRRGLESAPRGNREGVRRRRLRPRAGQRAESPVGRRLNRSGRPSRSDPPSGRRYDRDGR